MHLPNHAIQRSEAEPHWYCIIVGVLMTAWWANELRRGAWNRGDRTRGELGLHLAAEFVTASLLIASGSAWLVVGSARGRLGCSRPGNAAVHRDRESRVFLARRELPVVGMFGVLAALTVVALAVALA